MSATHARSRRKGASPAAGEKPSAAVPLHPAWKKKEKPRTSRKFKRIQSDDRGDLKPSHLENIRKGLNHLGVESQIKIWRYGHDRDTPHVGKPEKLGLYSFLILLSALTEDNSPAPLRDVAHAMRFRLTKESAARLGIPDDVYELTDGRSFWEVKHTEEESTVTFKIRPSRIYDRAQSAYTRLTELIEPYPGVATRQARPIKEVEKDVAALNESDILKKRQRMLWLMNAVVQGSLYRFNREQRRALLRHWGGSLAIDGTKVPVSAAKYAGGVRKEFRNCGSKEIHHAEAMASWYVRTGDHRGMNEDGSRPVSDAAATEIDWAYETALAVTIDEGDRPATRRAPNIVVGISFDAAAYRISDNSMTALRAAHQVTIDHGISPGTLVGDRAIMPNPKYEDLKKPAREMGYKFCHDYTVNQLGKVPGPLGTTMIEGRFYCPGTPSVETDATKNFRERLAADADGPVPDEFADDADAALPDDTYQQQLDRRTRFPLTVKSPVNAHGLTRLACPGTDPNGHLRCPLREAVVDKIEDPALRAKYQAIMNDGRTRVDVENPPIVAGEICMSHQASLTLELDEDTGKHYQDYERGSKKWQQMYGQRSQVETYNKDVKEDGLDDTKRRRGRGMAKQALHTALFVALTNVKRIRAYLAEHIAKHGPIPTDSGPTPLHRRGESAPPIAEDMPPPDRLAA